MESFTLEITQQDKDEAKEYTNNYYCLVATMLRHAGHEVKVVGIATAETNYGSFKFRTVMPNRYYKYNKIPDPVTGGYYIQVRQDAIGKTITFTKV